MPELDEPPPLELSEPLLELPWLGLVSVVGVLELLLLWLVSVVGVLELLLLEEPQPPRASTRTTKAPPMRPLSLKRLLDVVLAIAGTSVVVAVVICAIVL
jgi:hypothetical protein